MEHRLKKARVPFVGVEPFINHDGDAGSDLRASLSEPLTIEPGKSVKVDLDFRCAIPEGCVGLMFARSGLGSMGITMTNAVGVIDSGYRGPVRAPLTNIGERPVTINGGDRVCQLVIVEYVAPEWVREARLGGSERGEGGFGSSGLE